MNDTTETTIARDRSTSVTGLGYVLPAPPSYLGGDFRDSFSEGAISTGTKYLLTPNTCKSLCPKAQRNILESTTSTISRPLVHSPEQPIEILSKTKESPQPHPQIESSTDGSTKPVDNSPDQKLREERCHGLGSVQQGCQKYELARSFCKSLNSLASPKLVLAQNLPVRGDWLPRYLSLNSRIYSLAYCKDCKKFVYVELN